MDTHNRISDSKAALRLGEAVAVWLPVQTSFCSRAEANVPCQAFSVQAAEYFSSSPSSLNDVWDQPSDGFLIPMDRVLRKSTVSSSGSVRFCCGSKAAAPLKQDNVVIDGEVAVARVQATLLAVRPRHVVLQPNARVVSLLTAAPLCNLSPPALSVVLPYAYVRFHSEEDGRCGRWVPLAAVTPPDGGHVSLLTSADTLLFALSSLSTMRHVVAHLSTCAPSCEAPPTVALVVALSALCARADEGLHCGEHAPQWQWRIGPDVVSALLCGPCDSVVPHEPVLLPPTAQCYATQQYDNHDPVQIHRGEPLVFMSSLHPLQQQEFQIQFQKATALQAADRVNISPERTAGSPRRQVCVLHPMALASLVDLLRCRRQQLQLAGEEVNSGGRLLTTFLDERLHRDMCAPPVQATTYHFLEAPLHAPRLQGRLLSDGFQFPPWYFSPLSLLTAGRSALVSNPMNKTSAGTTSVLVHVSRNDGGVDESSEKFSKRRRASVFPPISPNASAHVPDVHWCPFSLEAFPSAAALEEHHYAILDRELTAKVAVVLFSGPSAAMSSGLASLAPPGRLLYRDIAGGVSATVVTPAPARCFSTVNRDGPPPVLSEVQFCRNVSLFSKSFLEKKLCGHDVGLYTFTAVALDTALHFPLFHSHLVCLAATVIRRRISIITDCAAALTTSVQHLANFSTREATQSTAAWQQMMSDVWEQRYLQGSFCAHSHFTLTRSTATNGASGLLVDNAAAVAAAREGVRQLHHLRALLRSELFSGRDGEIHSPSDLLVRGAAAFAGYYSWEPAAGRRFNLACVCTVPVLGRTARFPTTDVRDVGAVVGAATGEGLSAFLLQLSYEVARRRTLLAAALAVGKQHDPRNNSNGLITVRSADARATTVGALSLALLVTHDEWPVAVQQQRERYLRRVWQATVGGPERPLSDLGERAYASRWRAVVLAWLSSVVRVAVRNQYAHCFARDPQSSAAFAVMTAAKRRAAWAVVGAVDTDGEVALRFAEVLRALHEHPGDDDRRQRGAKRQRSRSPPDRRGCEKAQYENAQDVGLTFLDDGRGTVRERSHRSESRASSTGGLSMASGSEGSADELSRSGSCVPSTQDDRDESNAGITAGAFAWWWSPQATQAGALADAARCEIQKAHHRWRKLMDSGGSMAISNAANNLDRPGPAPPPHSFPKRVLCRSLAAIGPAFGSVERSDFLHVAAEVLGLVHSAAAEGQVSSHSGIAAVIDYLEACAPKHFTDTKTRGSKKADVDDDGLAIGLAEQLLGALAAADGDAPVPPSNPPSRTHEQGAVGGAAAVIHGATERLLGTWGLAKGPTITRALVAVLRDAIDRLAKLKDAHESPATPLANASVSPVTLVMVPVAAAAEAAHREASEQLRHRLQLLCVRARELQRIYQSVPQPPPPPRVVFDASGLQADFFFTAHSGRGCNRLGCAFRVVDPGVDVYRSAIEEQGTRIFT